MVQGGLQGLRAQGIDVLDQQTELQVIQTNTTFQMAIFGQTLAYFPQITNPAYDPTLGADGGLPTIRFTADMILIGDLVNPIPEPSAALLFVVGMMGSASMMRRAGTPYDSEDRG